MSHVRPGSVCKRQKEVREGEGGRRGREGHTQRTTRMPPKCARRSGVNLALVSQGVSGIHGECPGEGSVPGGRMNCHLHGSTISPVDTISAVNGLEILFFLLLHDFIQVRVAGENRRIGKKEEKGKRGRRGKKERR